MENVAVILHGTLSGTRLTAFTAVAYRALAAVPSPAAHARANSLLDCSPQRRGRALSSSVVGAKAHLKGNKEAVFTAAAAKANLWQHQLIVGCRRGHSFALRRHRRDSRNDAGKSDHQHKM